PMMPWSGNVRRISARIAVSAAWSAAVTGSNPPERPLSSMLSAVRKNGRMVSPDTDASSATKAEKSIAVMLRPPGNRQTCRSPLLGRSSACTHGLSDWARLGFLFPSAAASALREGHLCPENGHRHVVFPLLFVRCTVCCCGAVAPGVTAALLGRFLPRLGPLAVASGPFLLAS